MVNLRGNEIVLARTRYLCNTPPDHPPIEPKLPILDEPTEGIQPTVVHQIGDIILKLNKEEGLTVLLVEQKLPFARRVASEFCMLDKGRRVAAGPIGELTDEIVLAHLSV